MKFKILLALMLFAVLVNADVLILNDSSTQIVADAYVQQDNPTNNFGTYQYVMVRTQSGGAIRTFILINHSSLPSDSTIVNSMLYFYMGDAPTSSRTYQAYNTSAGWIESGGGSITWNTMPSLGTLQSTGSTGTTNGVWLPFNITNASISSFKQTDKNASIVIKDSSEADSTDIAYLSARENATASNRPYVVITYFNSSSSILEVRVFNESSTSQEIYYDMVISNSSTSETYNNQPSGTIYSIVELPQNSITIEISNDSFYSPRIYYTTLTNSSNQTLNAYLLPIGEGYGREITFFVETYSYDPLAGANVEVQKTISGWETIGEKTTGSDGGASFWLDSRTQYKVIANMSGYEPEIVYITPSGALSYYNIRLGVGNASEGFAGLFTDVNYTIIPDGGVIYNATNNITFQFTIHSRNSTLNSFGMNITNASGTQLFTQTSTTMDGGTITTSINVSKHSNYLNLSAFFVDNNYTTGTYVIYRTYYLYGINESVIRLVNITGEKGMIKDLGLSKGTLAILSLIFSVLLTGAFAKTGVSIAGSGVFFVLSLSFFALWGWLDLLLWLGVVVLAGCFIILKITG